MTKENNKLTNKANKANKANKENNLQVVKYIPRTISQIQIPHIIQISQIPLVPNLYHFYLSINKFFVKNKIYYQFYYYVLNNNQIDIIPNKKICPDNNIDSIYELTFKTSSIYIYNISNTELFKKLDLFNCKIRISIISVDLDSTENIFIKFFNEKKIFINEKNLELVKFYKNNSTDELDKLDNLFNNIII